MTADWSTEAREAAIKAHAAARNVPFPNVKDERAVDAVLDALAQHVQPLTDDWEWGWQTTKGDTLGPIRPARHTDAETIARESGHFVVRRRPAGEWEIAP